MQTMNMAFPVAKDKVKDLHLLAAELTGGRKDEFNDFLRRLNTTEERWTVQEINGETYCLLYLAGDDLGAAFGALATSKHPFDVWMKKQNGDVLGMDFEKPSDDPMPVEILGHITYEKELVS